MTVVASAPVFALLGISSSGKLVLGGMAAVFIIFALVVSFVLPRRSPDFPGNRMGLFVAATVVLFLAMMTAVVTTAGGEKGEHGAAQNEHAETEPPATTGPAATETEGGETEAAETEEERLDRGDPIAGEEVFASAGCGGCHALAAANASGTVGPSLDESEPAFELVVDRVTNGQGAMPAFGDQLSEEQIRNVAAYVVETSKG